LLAIYPFPCFDSARDTITPALLNDLTTVDESDSQLTINQYMLYRQIVGSVLYVSNVTRPDITHTVNMLARFVSCPTLKHLTAGIHLLRYLKHTKKMKLLFRCSDTPNWMLTIYTDSNWGGDKGDRKSTTGYLVMVNGNCVAWQSKKQTTIALSSMEAEYYAIAAGLSESMWCQALLYEMTHHLPTMRLLTDSASAIAVATSEDHHHRSKHIDIRYSFIKDVISRRNVSINWVSTLDQLADVLTKSLSRVKFIPIRDELLTD
jgi:hypothetical protein